MEDVCVLNYRRREAVECTILICSSERVDKVIVNCTESSTFMHCGRLQ